MSARSSSRNSFAIGFSISGEPEKSFTVFSEGREAIEQRSPERGLVSAIEHLSSLTWSGGDDVAVTIPAGTIIADLGRPPYEPPEVGELRKRVLVHFIEAQRLFKIAPQPASPWRRDRAVTSVVNEVAEQMAVRIKETDSAYRTTSTRLDDSLPARLFTSSGNSTTMPASEMQQRTEALERERQRLRDIGLLANPTTSFDPNELAMGRICWSGWRSSLQMIGGSYAWVMI